MSKLLEALSKHGRAAAAVVLFVIVIIVLSEAIVIPSLDADNQSMGRGFMAVTGLVGAFLIPMGLKKLGMQ